MILLLIILALAASPLISAMVAGWVAEANHCRLDEGGIHPCLVNGTDIGPDLYTFFVLGWLMLATLPLGAIALAIWLAILIIHLVIHLRRKSNPPQSAASQ
ncbi:MAG: hypothetical protein H6873_02880 [Hyphomicrobiaceae bacterium]|nr:hypothetical protein [Hyphomicrobiaceae bacterium]